MAAARGIPVFVDAAPADKNYNLEALPQLEVFSPNESETYEYTGILPQGAESSLRAALMLSKRIKSKYIVIKQGARGSFVYDGKHFRMIPPYRPERVVDTTAAGDVYTSALTLEYLRCGDIISAAKYASAAAAIAVSRAGAGTSVPSAEEVAEFMRTHPYI